MTMDTLRVSSTFSEPKAFQTFDASDYESATYIQDLNLPVKSELHLKFSTLIDLGTLEHVFNFPQAIKNCMELVEVGGDFISVTPAKQSFRTWILSI